jgi:anti-sigma B factor antagonist
MNIESERNKSAVVLKLDGRLDTANAPLLERKLKQHEGITEMTLDFEYLEYISSMGLRVLLAAKKEMKSEGINLIIINMQDSVREVFEMTGFLNLMVQEEKFVVIRKDDPDGGITLSFNGEMKNENVSTVSKEFAKIKKQSQDKAVKVILDMEKLDYISPAAAKALKKAITDTGLDAKNFSVCNVSPDVQKILDNEELY